MNTTKGVLRWGYPYLDRYGEPFNNSYGDLFNMPPLGFYIGAVYFSVFAANEQNGVALMTAFGLGCVVLVYLIGNQLYNRLTGLVAAGLFGLAPWQLILSRAYLIDSQSLFLSLLCLYFGFLAIRKESARLALVSGVCFAAALMTKQFAVFVLIPLFLLYLYHKPKSFRAVSVQIVAFGVPAVAANFVWYQLVLGRDLFYLFAHNDLKDLNFTHYTPVYSFLSDFYIYYGLGAFFVAATVFALVSSLLLRRQLSNNILFSDAVCFVIVGVVSGLVMFFGVTMDLKAPYVSAVKYAYQALPYFCLLAASLVIKSKYLLEAAHDVDKYKKAGFITLGFTGIGILASVVVADFAFARQLAHTSYMVFRVQPNLDVGYSFFVNQPLGPSSPLVLVQLMGFMLVILGLVWTGKDAMIGVLKTRKV